MMGRWADGIGWCCAVPGPESHGTVCTGITKQAEGTPGNAPDNPFGSPTVTRRRMCGRDARPMHQDSLQSAMTYPYMYLFRGAPPRRRACSKLSAQLGMPLWAAGRTIHTLHTLPQVRGAVDGNMDASVRGGAGGRWLAAIAGCLPLARDPMYFVRCCLMPRRAVL